jgi:hypothetical protein
MENHEQHAKDLFEKFYGHCWQKHTTTKRYKIEGMSKSAAIWCAKVTVDEVIKNIDAGMTYHPESKALPINKEYWLRVLASLNAL